MHDSLIENAAVAEPGVQIWRAHIDAISASDFLELTASLDDHERVRAGRFHFEKDRHRYAATRGLLRRLLGDALGLAPAAVDLSYGPHGKPTLAHASLLRFNISHSEGWALFALTNDRDIGIDLESADRLPSDPAKLSGLAARVLSARELTAWEDLADHEKQRRAFLRAWTRKEAYAKATGRGIFDALGEVEVALDCASPSGMLRVAGNAGETSGGWIIHDVVAPHNFAAAISIAQTGELR